MRIGLFTDTYYPEINGVATSTQQLKKGLEALGNEVYVFAPDNSEAYTDDKNVIRKYSIPFILLRDRRCCIFRIKKAVKEIEELKLDIVHSQTEFVMGHMARLTAEKYNIPHIHTYHTVYEDYTHYLKIPGKNSEFVKNLVRRLSRIMCEKADKIIVPTNKVEALLKSYNVKKDIYVQPTGIDSHKFANIDHDKVIGLKEKYAISSKNKILVMAGRMSKEKNMIEIINYLPEIIKVQPDTILVVVGDGPEKNNIKNKVKSLGIEKNVIFTGVVPWSEMQYYYALGDIFVCASTSETQGLTYIEALFAGKPLLVRYDDCLENVLINGVNGIGYSNSQEFVKGYFDIYKDYDSFQKASIKSVDRYSNLSFAKNIFNIYNKAIER